MNPRTIIAPSILAADLGTIETEIRSVEDGGADWLHIDVMDGTFVPPITFGAHMVRAARKISKLPLDVHLMIVDPGRHIEAFADAGATSLTVHREACPQLHRILGAIRSAGMKPGVSVNPGTPVESIFDVLELCELVLLMTVNPGWGGQTFIPRSIDRISRLKAEIDRQKLSTRIEVDGGIEPDTGRQCVNAGASILVAGTSIFGQPDRKKAIESLR